MSEAFSSLKRNDIMTKMQETEFDLLVIGGGITGAGIALDATSRGMKTGLLEMQDFAAGTSSRSSKMVHGGLRYLKKYEFKIVSETGKERAIVYENGPHVTTPEWMILPIYKDAQYGMFMTSIGLRVYDFLAGVKKKERNKMFKRDTLLKMEPKFKKEGLVGGGKFVEYRSDDARLTIEVLKEAANLGANVINYTKVIDFIYQDGKVVGVKAVDQMNGKVSEIRAKKVVNAAGPWVDTLREKDHSLDDKKMHITKGIHLVFDQSVLPLKQSVYFDTPDGRMILMIPRDKKVYVGTTDTEYTGDLANPRISKKDIEYILKCIHFIFPNTLLKESDIESSWAGVRPLIHQEGKSASAISRKDDIWESKSGLITIAGGKLTGYRKMAETIVNLVSAKFTQEYGLVFSSCQTKHMPISGGHVGGSDRFPAFVEEKVRIGIEKVGLTKEVAYKLTSQYGSNVDELYHLIEKYKHEAKVFKLPIELYAQVRYAIEAELTYTPVDFFWRRTGAALFNIDWVKKWQGPVIQLMEELLHWNKEQTEHYRMELNQHLHNLIHPVEE